MNAIKGFDRSVKAKWGLTAVIFLVMLGFNLLTPYVADDYTYHHSWADWSRLTSPLQIPASMYAHGRDINGRIVAHAWEQFFLLLPKLVFNFCNAAVYAWLIREIHRICVGKRQDSAILLALAAMGFWCVLPFFGQVCLWQDGAVNYLWALAAGLFFLRPFLAAADSEQGQTDVCNRLWKRGLFCLGSVLVGMYSEVTSLTVLLMAIALTVFVCLRHRRFRTWLWFPLAAGALGYALLLLMPAEIAHKSGSFAWADMEKMFERVSDFFWERFGLLLMLWVVLMICACLRKTDGRRRLLSLLFVLGAVCAAYTQIAAPGIAPRVFCTTALFLFIACLMLLRELAVCGYEGLAYGIVVAVTVVFSSLFYDGTADLIELHQQQVMLEEEAQRGIEQGARTLVLPRFTPRTEYNPSYKLEYQFSLDDPRAWYNDGLAFYYGVDAVLAKLP